MVNPPKYNDFVAAATETRVAQGVETEYTLFACPYPTCCKRVAIPTVDVGRLKSTRCLHHLNTQCKATEADSDPRARSRPGPTRRAPEHDVRSAVVCTDPHHAALATQNDSLTVKNDSLTGRVHSLEQQNREHRDEMARMRAKLEAMEADSRARNRREAHRDAVLRACSDALGIQTPPVPAPCVYVDRIDGFKKAARTNASARPAKRSRSAGGAPWDDLAADNARLQRDNARLRQSKVDFQQLAGDPRTFRVFSNALHFGKRTSMP